MIFNKYTNYPHKSSLPVGYRETLKEKWRHRSLIDSMLVFGMGTYLLCILGRNPLTTIKALLNKPVIGHHFPRISNYYVVFGFFLGICHFRATSYKADPKNDIEGYNENDIRFILIDLEIQKFVSFASKKYNKFSDKYGSDFARMYLARAKKNLLFDVQDHYDFIKALYLEDIPRDDPRVKNIYSVYPVTKHINY